MTTTLKQYEPLTTTSQGERQAPLLIGAKELALLLGVSVRHLRRMDAAGELPRPVTLGKRVLWRTEEIQRWVAARCPDRRSWEATDRSHRK